MPEDTSTNAKRCRGGRPASFWRARKVGATALSSALFGAVACGLGGGLALAATNSGSIHGCYNKSTGELRVAAVCTSHENAIIWSVQGPPGAAGWSGAQGTVRCPRASGAARCPRAPGRAGHSGLCRYNWSGRAERDNSGPVRLLVRRPWHQQVLGPATTVAQMTINASGWYEVLASGWLNITGGSALGSCTLSPAATRSGSPKPLEAKG